MYQAEQYCQPQLGTHFLLLTLKVLLNPCVTPSGTFFFLLIVVFALEMGIGVAAYMKYGHLEEILDKGFQSTLDTYEQSMDSRHAWDLIQGEVRPFETVAFN